MDINDYIPFSYNMITYPYPKIDACFVYEAQS